MTSVVLSGDMNKFQPLIDHYDSPPNAGQLFILCMTTKRKELLAPAVFAFLKLLERIDMRQEDKVKIVRKLDERIEKIM